MLAIDQLSRIMDAVRPVIDIGILAFIFYKAYVLVIKTNGLQLLWGAIIMGLAYVIAIAFKLETLLWLLNIIAPGLLVCFAIVFQPESRKCFLKIGQREWFSYGNRSKHTYVDSVLIAAESLSKMRRGMLVCFLRYNNLSEIIESGIRINADLSSQILVTIFGHDTPLHDAACIIQNGRILAAGCFLPLSEQYDIKKTFGTRHRAALGLSEQSDAVILVVSEETGAISLAYDSRLQYDLSEQDLRKKLEELLEITPDDYKIEDTIDESKKNN